MHNIQSSDKLDFTSGSTGLHAGVMEEFVNSNGVFELQEPTTDLDTRVRAQMEKIANPLIRDIVDLRTDVRSAVSHETQEQHNSDQNVDRLSSGASKLDRLSVEVQDLQTRTYRRSRRLRATTSSTERPMGDAACVSVDNLGSPPFGQNGILGCPTELHSAAETDTRPHQSVVATYSPLLPAANAELVEPFEKANPRHSEPTKMFGDPQLNQGFLGPSNGQRQKGVAPSKSKKCSSMQSHLLKDKSVVENVEGSCSRQDESMVANVPDVEIVRSSSSEPVQPIPLKRKRSVWNGGNSSSGSANISRSIKMRGSGSRRMERSRHGLHNAAAETPIEVDDFEFPRRLGDTVNLEDDEEANRARQLAEDEILARFLQEEYNFEAIPGDLTYDDAQVARMLQEQENSRSVQPSQTSRSNHPLSNRQSTAMQAVRREMQRVLPSIRTNSGRAAVSSSRTRILRGLRSRSNQHQTRGHLIGGTGQNLDGNMVHFPDDIDVDTRLDILAAIESVMQEIPSFQELQLEQIDRDFNENDYEMLLALDDVNHYHNGASQDRIGQLPISTLQPTDVYEENCSICLERPNVGEKVRRLPCMHGFHQKCVDRWLKRQANCPVCKCSI